MTLTYVETKEIPISDLISNDLSANNEDETTFERLKQGLYEDGLIEFPSVLITGLDQYRIISGHHRIYSWRDIGNDTIICNVFQGTLEPEDEFNLVNNMNQIRGKTTLSSMRKIIHNQNLDISKLDIYKFPVTKLMPQMKDEKRDIGISDIEKRAKIRDFAMKISHKIAEIMIDDIDSSVVVFRIDDSPIAVIQIHPRIKPQIVKKNISIFKEKILEIFDQWLGGNKGDVQDFTEENTLNILVNKRSDYGS